MLYSSAVPPSSITCMMLAPSWNLNANIHSYKSINIRIKLRINTISYACTYAWTHIHIPTICAATSAQGKCLQAADGVLQWMAYHNPGHKVQRGDVRVYGGDSILNH